ncbi:MAG TPA: 23S rRNA (uracil(1939)-C(5))-methyltransferase RlmD [Burkholderiales bacterium]|nr:23S rRNA (uracil(1939)-C(5))-methyltransferase RlmD [Burkholderiales bacterium]
MIRVESLDQEGRGVAHASGKVIFIEGALPGEMVSYAPFRKKPSFEIARAENIVEPSPARVAPRCRHFGTCGGCSLQHLDVDAQVAVKQRVLEDTLWHIGKIRPRTMLPAIYGAPWGYRHRARFSARFIPKKGGLLIGFHEKRSSYVADMTSCEIVPPRISALLIPLRGLLGALSIRDRVPQLELAIGDDMDALVLRVLQPPTPEDENLLRQFADRHRVRFFLQPGGPDSATPLEPARGSELHYSLPEFALKIRFSPTDFTQVNHAVNAVLVRRALALLDPRPGERIADMFCGLGNFSLAIARRGGHVAGIEGSAPLVAAARSNADSNGLAAMTDFVQADLFKVDGRWLAQLGRFDRMLLDPPRDGAIELVKALAGDAANAPARVVYVSCNPATLARDAAVLAYAGNYALSSAGIVNMFPHTSHVESIAIFDRQ